MIFSSKIKEVFGVENATSTAMQIALSECAGIYQGQPRWLWENDNIKTINFAKSLCSETARLTTLAIKITIDGSARAKWLQKQIDNIYFKIREWVEYGCAYGTVIMKPSTDGIDLFTPEKYVITEYKNKTITGVVFIYQRKDSDKYFTRFEYHHYVSKEEYTVYNRCCVGDSYNNVSEEIDIKLTPWNGLLEDANITGMSQPAYGVFKTPHANNIDINSAIGLPILSDAIVELEDLDIAYSRNAKEIKDSKRILLLDSDRMLPSDGRKISDLMTDFESNRTVMGLPDMVKNVWGDGKESFYQEINPTLNTEMRLSGINALLNQIGYKVGYSNGHFVFNETKGIQTATQVEADQQRTIQFIKDVRDKLEDCMNDVISGLNMFANVYSLAPAGDYEVIYDFSDITYNYEEEKTRWWGYVVAGRVPAEYYFMKFEGMSEKEAKQMVLDAEPKQRMLFGM